MVSDFALVGMNESQQQLFENFLRPRLEAELQQQVTIYSQQIAEALVYHAHRVTAEHIDAFLQQFQNIPRSPFSPLSYGAQGITSKVAAGASGCRRYLFLPVSLPPTTILFQGNFLSSFRSTPCAMLQQALSSTDMVELLGHRGTPSTYLPL
jgi:hypothetical protein